MYCNTCKKETNNDRKYCSRKCSNQRISVRPEKQTHSCAFCGKNTTNKKYCCNLCKNRPGQYSEKRLK